MQTALEEDESDHAVYAIGSLMTDWTGLGLQQWLHVAQAHARQRPSVPLSLIGLSVPEVRDAIAMVLAGSTLTPSTFSKVVRFTDYSGRTVSQRLGYFCTKLSNDVGHAAHAGWIGETLANPIEVWDRIDLPTDVAPKRHYFSAYSNPAGTVLYYVAVAVAANGKFITGFQKVAAGGIDNKRNGTHVYRCY